MPREDLITPRRGIASLWTSTNPVLDEGEYGYETDTLKHKYGDGVTAWNDLPYAGGGASTPQDLQNVLDTGGNALLFSGFESTEFDMDGLGLNMQMEGNNSSLYQVRGVSLIGNWSSSDFSKQGSIVIDPDSASLSSNQNGLTTEIKTENGILLISSNAVTKTTNLKIETPTAGSENANVIVPKITSVGDKYIPLSFTDGVNTEVSNNEGVVDLSSFSGGGTALTGQTFTGAIALDNTLSTYYNPYDLSVSGTPTYSVLAGAVTSGQAYIPIISDGVTPFATEANFNPPTGIFDEQYNVPADYILDSGLHRLYILKTADGVAISAPQNGFLPDVIAPTVSTATVDVADELIVIFSEDVNVTNTTGLSFDGGLIALTIDSIISGNGTNTVTFQLSGDVVQGDTGNFVYGGTNTVEDLSGNALASGTTAVTNNIITGEFLVWEQFVNAQALGVEGGVESDGVFTVNYGSGALATKAINGDNTLEFYGDYTKHLIGLAEPTYAGIVTDGQSTLPIAVNLFNSSTLLVRENNATVLTLAGTYSNTDKIEIIRTGTVVTVELNDAVIYTSGLTFNAASYTPVYLISNLLTGQILTSKFSDATNLIVSPL